MNVTETFQFLSNYYDLSIDDKKVKPYIEFLKDSNITPEVLKYVYRPTTVRIGTVGAFIWGCLQNYYGCVSRNCSPLCINSLFGNKEIDCPYSVWVQEGNELKKEYNTSSIKAYVYGESSENGEPIFKKSDIDKLKHDGIQYVTILNTKNSTHKILQNMIPVENIPIMEQKKYVETSDNSFYIFLVVIFVFLAMVVYLYFSRR